ncbi:MAG: hypothetical protein F6K56_04515 [Moorea sp. SIO3G5]|nr:hypothetical protein [Moorena sp. SIO3G5]
MVTVESGMAHIGIHCGTFGVVKRITWQNFPIVSLAVQINTQANGGNPHASINFITFLSFTPESYFIFLD